MIGHLHPHEQLKTLTRGFDAAAVSAIDSILDDEQTRHDRAAPQLNLSFGSG